MALDTYMLTLAESLFDNLIVIDEAEVFVIVSLVMKYSMSRM